MDIVLTKYGVKSAVFRISDAQKVFKDPITNCSACIQFFIISKTFKNISISLFSW